MRRPAGYLLSKPLPVILLGWSRSTIHTQNLSARRVRAPVLLCKYIGWGVRLMGRMYQQRLCGEEGAYSCHGGLALCAESPPIIRAGHTSCEPLPLDDVRPFLAASISVTMVFFLGPQPRWLGFDVDELAGQNRDSVGFVGVEDRTFPPPSKGWRVLSGILREEVPKETHGRVRHLLIESGGTRPRRSSRPLPVLLLVLAILAVGIAAASA